MITSTHTRAQAPQASTSTTHVLASARAAAASFAACTASGSRSSSTIEFVAASSLFAPDVPPFLNETHDHGRWEQMQKRLDIEVRGSFPQLDAHGIIGQSYKDSTVRNGKLDEYGALDTPELISSDGTGPEMWTKAQAEGAIEGVYTDYRLSGPFATSFKFSQYDRQPSAAAKKGAMRTASTSETEGHAPPPRKKEL